ncbi:MAG: hypothetical protein LBH36_02485 [Candidatus Nomurabacteria bacterium]|jgi:hypothetical protein|nr:hypothetical protein [Candidatus Nomurabacteria bacterium]
MEKSVYKTQDLVEALRAYNPEHKTTVTDCLIDYLADFVEKQDYPYDEDPVYGLEHYLDEVLLRAITALANSDEEWVVAYRERYKKDYGDDRYPGDPTLASADTFDFFTLHECENILEGTLSQFEWLDFSMLHSEAWVLQLHFERFLDQIHIRGGMREVINNAKVDRVGGVFGKTKLLTKNGMGRLLFTFHRGKVGTKNYHSITFTMSNSKCDNGGNNVRCFGAGIQLCYTDVITGLQMIKDVTDNWDVSKFVEDRNRHLVKTE